MPPDSEPFVSVIAPCRNEAKFIANTIRSILDNDYPDDKLEIIVVDGMSNDGTREIIEGFAEKDSRVKMLDNPDKIVPTAMNIGIKNAVGKYIMRIDCHSKFSADYIRSCIRVSQRTGAENVGGYWITLPGDNTPTAKAIAAATSSMFGVGNSDFRLTGPEKETDTVPFGTYRKKLFNEIGMFDERLVRNQDIELNSRIRKKGGRIIISPEIKLSYYNRATFCGLWQQSFNNGLWNPYTIWLVGKGLSLRHFIPMFFVLGLITFVVSSIWLPAATWLLFVYLVLYLVCATVFACITAKIKRCSFILILWSYVILHLAYGMGSLWGVLTVPFKLIGHKKATVGKALPDRKT